MDVNAKTDCEVGKVKYLKWKNDVIAEIILIIALTF